MPARGREVVTGAVAVAGHVALLALTFVVHRSEPPPPPADDRVDQSTLIQLLVDMPYSTVEKPPAPSSSQAPAAVAAPREPRGGPGAAREVVPDLPAPAQPEASASPAGTATSAPSSEFDGPAPAVPMVGGGLVIGTPVWAVPGALPRGAGAAGTGAPAGPIGPRVAQAPGKTVLRDTMLARDGELGLGNPGATAVANAVAEAVRGSTVPPESSAVIVAHIGGDGVVVSVGVQQFSAGDVKAWNGVAQAATAALAKRKIGLAGLGPKGAIVQVAVRSSVTLPSGAKSPVQGVLPSLTEGPPRDVMPAPSPDGDSCAPERWSDVKPMCGVGMKIGGFDVADMVAKPHRSVKTSFGVKLLDDALALATPSAPAVSATPSAPAPASAAPSVAVPPAAADAGAP